MNMKIGLAAAVFAAVGTFAFAEGAGEYGCGDGWCVVGQDGHFGAGHYEWNNHIIRSGTFVETETGFATAGIYENFALLDGKGIYYRLPIFKDEIFVGVTGLLHDDGVALSTGNCSGLAGESGTNGCNLLD